jgi:hypothetical protein
MKQEFYEVYQKLFSDAYNRLRRALTLKLKAMRMCDEMKSARSMASSNHDPNEPQNIAKHL